MKDTRENKAAAHNPYAAPQSPDVAEDAMLATPRDEAIRRQYLTHEKAVQAIGVFFAIAAALFLIGVLLLLMHPAGTRQWFRELVRNLAAATGCFVAVWGLQTLQHWVRYVVIAVSVPALFLFPAGTVLGVIPIAVMCSRHTRIVLSREYRDVVRRTPHLSHSKPLSLRVLIALALIGFVLYQRFLRG